ncbi:MAG: hypothetical protein CHACPFDD_03112 [Phycisphaerae bacterium]|nr:hypothetical protein [Phycisphaerae bacterium]
MSRAAANRTGLVRELIDALAASAEIRRDLCLLYSEILGWQVQFGLSTEDRHYLAGVQRCASEVKRILEMRATPTLLRGTERRRQLLLREFAECDQSAQDGWLSATRIAAELEQMDSRESRDLEKLLGELVVDGRGSKQDVPSGERKTAARTEFLALVRKDADGSFAAYRVSATSGTVGCQCLERELRGLVVATFPNRQEAARSGFNFDAAPWFTVAEFESGSDRNEKSHAFGGLRLGTVPQT